MPSVPKISSCSVPPKVEQMEYGWNKGETGELLCVIVKKLRFWGLGRRIWVYPTLFWGRFCYETFRARYIDSYFLLVCGD